MTTAEKVIDLIAKQLNKQTNEISVNSEIVKDLGADSLDVVEMLMTFEEEFGIVVPEEEATKLVTVKDIVDLIDNKQ
ncbi:MAG: acyl carrier protein [Clostridia bacterium]|nr:acyl carrier protein [Clostridia bacterium]